MRLQTVKDFGLLAGGKTRNGSHLKSNVKREALDGANQSSAKRWTSDDLGQTDTHLGREELLESMDVLDFGNGKWKLQQIDDA